jgi:hypothetical protein
MLQLTSGINVCYTLIPWITPLHSNLHPSIINFHPSIIYNPGCVSAPLDVQFTPQNTLRSNSVGCIHDSLGPHYQTTAQNYDYTA